MEILQELVQFLRKDSKRTDVQIIALQQILGTTTDEEMCASLTNESCTDLMDAIISLIDHTNEDIRKLSSNILLNLTAEHKWAENILNHNPHLLQNLITDILHPDSINADECCKILNNLSAHPTIVEQICDVSKSSFDKLISAFLLKNYNKHQCTLDYLAKVFGNLTQSPMFRKFIMDREKFVIQRLLPFTQFTGSKTRQAGIVALIKNCCFDSENHEWLLSDKVDILPSLLLPLAGGEEFSDEENDKLPIELQYLPNDKKREENAGIKKILLETLLQLCSIKSNREFIRDKNTYLILRELHKNEDNPEVLLACENVVDLLIRTEEEIGVEDYKQVEIPEDMVEKLEKMDDEYLKS